jgi:putative transcriptional regulator
VELIEAPAALTAPWIEGIIAMPERTKKTKGVRNTPTSPKSESRSLFRELMSGVEAMRERREGRLTLRTHEVAPIAVPPMNPQLVRETREALHMSRQVFALKLGVNPRTLERWEQGRSKPNEQAAALIWLVRKYPDTLERLESLSVPG